MGRVSNDWDAYFAGKYTHGPNGCVLWNRAMHNLGYGVCGRTAGEVKTHRASWALVHGEIPKGLGVLHKCDVRNCINPDHLFLGTHKENMEDMVRKGRLVQAPKRFGTDNAMSVLTADDVWAIRYGLIKIFSQTEIAKSYRVGKMTISRIVSGKAWPHITQTTMT